MSTALDSVQVRIAEGKMKAAIIEGLNRLYLKTKCKNLIDPEVCPILLMAIIQMLHQKKATHGLRSLVQ